MPFYIRAGSVPTKRHVQVPRPSGGLYAEELFSTKGFAGPHSLLYHANPPTAVLDIRSWKRPETVLLPNEPLSNRHWITGRSSIAGDAVDARLPLLGNDDVLISLACIDAPMEYFHRNAGGDELFFIHFGSGVLETPFGDIAYRAHDYLIIPTGTTYRLQPAASTRALMYAVRGAVEIPRRFLGEFGQLAEHAPYCERDFRVPHLRDPIDAPGEYPVHISHRERGAIHVLRNHPFDLIGWDGCCYPYAFNLDDYAPVTGLLHQPPPAHATFQAPGLAFCAFVPRLIDYHPQAIPIPYNHANVDCDEVLYYVNGTFLSRRGISEGSLTLHPAGVAHGPQPGAVADSLGSMSTNELAVMLDTFAPLRIAQDARVLEDADYFRSWTDSK
jgi:homogentisate 1,2-dioxygenase